MLLSLTPTLALLSADLRDQGLRVVMGHGCFDNLHVGHLRYLRAAKALGDVLIVTVTSDRYVQKGPDRPVFNESLRAEALSALDFVDFVSINDGPDASEAILWIKPAVFVKGPECRDPAKKTPGLLKEEAAVQSVGGVLAYTETEVWSSTEVLRRVLAT